MSDSFFNVLFTPHRRGDRCSWECLRNQTHKSDARACLSGLVLYRIHEGIQSLLLAFTPQHICRVRVGVAAKDDDDSQQSSRNSWHVPDDFVLEMFHNDMARRGLELISDESCDPLRMQEEVVKASQSIIPISG